jgi:transposase
MRRGRPIAPLILTQEEQTLERWARRPKSVQALAQRSRVILACADGSSNTVVAAQLKLTLQTVGKWRGRFVNKRLDGLLDEPRPGTPLRLSNTKMKRVLAMTLEATPKDATHWSTRSMAQACVLSHTTVRRIWNAFALAPHRSESFKLSKDPPFIEKVRRREPVCQTCLNLVTLVLLQRPTDTGRMTSQKARHF